MLQPVRFKISKRSAYHRNIVFTPVISEKSCIDITFSFAAMFEKVLVNSRSLKEQEDVIMMVSYIAFVVLGVSPLLDRWFVFFRVDVFRINAVQL